VPPGETIHVGGAVRKDVAGYDVRSLLIGSEGTLGIVTSAWLRLIPAPESRPPVAPVYPDTASACAAIEAVMASGVCPAAIEYLDPATLAHAPTSFVAPESGAGFLVIVEVDGTHEEVLGARELSEAMRPGASLVRVLSDPPRRGSCGGGGMGCPSP